MMRIIPCSKYVCIVCYTPEYTVRVSIFAFSPEAAYRKSILHYVAENCVSHRKYSNESFKNKLFSFYINLNIILKSIFASNTCTCQNLYNIPYLQFRTIKIGK